MKINGKFRILTVLSFTAFISGCHPYFKDDIVENDPYYAPAEPQQISPALANNGSLYHEGFGITLFNDNLAQHVGDILTVRFNEDIKSNSDSTSSTKRNTSIIQPGATLLSDQVNGLNIPKLLNITSKVNDVHTDSYDGTGKSVDDHKFEGYMTVSVSEVLPNGHLRIRGEKWVTLNADQRYMRLTGIVRRADIDKDNQITSDQIADARISYGGKGLISDNSLPGWIARFFLSPRWPL